MRLFLLLLSVLTVLGIRVDDQIKHDYFIADDPTGVAFVHIAFTGNPSEMMISYFTHGETNFTAAMWGTSSGQYSSKALGVVQSWLEDYGYSHHVMLSGLAPSTKYYYIVGDNSYGWSQEYYFVTQPAAISSFTIGVYGDMGIVNSQTTIDRVLNIAQTGVVDWIYHIGDITYADDHPLSFQETWNTWFTLMDPIMSYTPYMVLPGNHEYCSYNPILYPFTKDFVVYNQRFRMPFNKAALNSSMYYSFDYGPVHFISYSTETSFPDAPYPIIFGNDFGDEVAWLKNDLAQANKNRDQTPWIIVGGHRPIYSSCEGYSSNGIPSNDCLVCNSATLQTVFEDIFFENKVDLIINGHVHSYERNYPTYRNKRVGNYTNPAAPVSIVVGCAGNIEGLENGGGKGWTPQPEWSAYRFGDSYGYGVLNVDGAHHLNWQFYRSDNGALQDEFDIYK